MKITSYVDLTPAQEKTLESFETVLVRTKLSKPAILATFSTFQAQQVRLTIDANGVIEEVELVKR